MQINMNMYVKHEHKNISFIFIYKSMVMLNQDSCKKVLLYFSFL
jgi:hypothetical protein